MCWGQIWDLDDTSAPCWAADQFSTLPPILPAEVPSAQAHGHQHRDQHQHQQHKVTARCEIREILVTNLGDEISKEPWLIVSFLPRRNSYFGIYKLMFLQGTDNGRQNHLLQALPLPPPTP